MSLEAMFGDTNRHVSVGWYATDDQASHNIETKEAHTQAESGAQSRSSSSILGIPFSESPHWRMADMRKFLINVRRTDLTNRQRLTRTDDLKQSSRFGFLFE